MKTDPLKPSPQLLIKLGSLITHYQELTSPSGHPADKAATNTIEDDEDFQEWMKEMRDMAFLPVKR